MTYIVKVRARQDPKKYWRWIARDDLEAADRFLLAAEVTFAAISKNPNLGSQRSFRSLVGIRSWQIRGFERFLVFYRQNARALSLFASSMA